MTKSFVIINGDILTDSRGRMVTSEGHTKVAAAVNYALSNSTYIQGIFSTLHNQDNEDVIRWAITSTMNELIALYRDASWLPDNERVKNIGYLKISQATRTTVSFVLEVNTYANTTFNVSLERT